MVCRRRVTVPLSSIREGSHLFRFAVLRRVSPREGGGGAERQHLIKAEATSCLAMNLSETATLPEEILRGIRILSPAVASAVEKLCALPRGPNARPPILCYLAFFRF